MQHIDGDQERLACRCCGERTDDDAYCLPCYHKYDRSCSRQIKPKCGYCGFMIGTDGICMRISSHRELPV